MQVFEEGRGTGWQHIYFKIEYETTRSGPNVGIKYKITWDIDKYYYFGYNLVAEVWVEGTNYGRQIKANTPNRGSGTAYFPDSGYLWFNKGYATNAINGNRVKIYSTNGGTPNVDTGAETTFAAPTGAIASEIKNSIDLNIGNSLNITISDITNVNYTYNLYLYVQETNDVYTQVATKNTTSKNFVWDLSSIINTLYSKLSTRNSAKIRIKLETRLNNTLIGYTIKEGNCYVLNSNPNAISFTILKAETNTEITSIVAGYGPYNPNSNVKIRIPKIANSNGKNSATLKEAVLEVGNSTNRIPITTLVGTGNYEVALTDPFNLNDDEYVNGKAKAMLSVVDSRGNKTTTTKEISATKLVLPQITSVDFKRDNGVDTKTKMIVKGKLGTYNLYTNLGLQYYLDDGGEIGNMTKYRISLTSSNVNTNNGTFSYEGYINGDLGAEGFTSNQAFPVLVRVYTNITYSLDNEGLVYSSVPTGEILMHYSKQYKAIGIGQKYNNANGGKIQIEGLPIFGTSYSSSSEQKVGIWEDGKQLYRKVIKGKTATDNDSTYINVGNIKIHMINGNVIRGDGYKFFIPFNENGQSYIVVFQMPDTRLRIIAKNSSNGFRNSEYNLVIEYTKN